MQTTIITRKSGVITLCNGVGPDPVRTLGRHCGVYDTAWAANWGSNPRRNARIYRCVRVQWTSIVWEALIGRRSITGGVTPSGSSRIRFDFHIDGAPVRPTWLRAPNEANLRRALARMVLIKTQIAAGTFSFAEEFPKYRLRRRLGLPSRTVTCSEVFDAFLRHAEARVARDDLAPRTLSSHRQILDHV